MLKSTENPSGIYIHIPFCKKKCNYCDFYSEDEVDEFEIAKYTKKIISELDKRWDELSDTDIVSVYIGGGTPSTLKNYNIKSISDFLASKGLNFERIEFTMEINPSDATPEFLEFIKESGINRVSMGLQAFDDKVLLEMGRLSKTKEIIKALELLKDRFLNYSVDIMYGIGKNRNLKKELENIFAICSPAHISAYAYTAPERENCPVLLSEEETIVHESTIQTFLKDKGLDKYEVSNYALPGKESIHNMIYWNYRSWLGIGAGSCSFISKLREHSFYQSSISDFNNDCGISRYTPSVNEQIEEFLLMGLRLVKGIDLDRFKTLFGKEFEDCFNMEKVQTLIDSGFCLNNNRIFKCTDKGMLYLNFVLVEIIRWMI